MKTIHSFLLLASLTLAATGCANESGVTVGSDQRGTNPAATNAGYISTATDQPDFSKYKSYSWSSQITDPQNSVFFLNDLIFKGQIRDAVEHEMAAKGYTYQPDNGDLVVNFRTFDQPVELASNDNLGAGYWSDNERYAYNNRNKVKLDRGSILVQMADRQKGVQVWQGYASGLTDGNVFDKNKDKVYVAIGQIFQTYDHRADKL
ncbi:DUF4136 domain-containing protein [Hymenobacter artigasi]|uniref:DUF4136 domain-containing protein n=1 Tax=Hymenobacter artigasi TaxID=2719616 RepID=A0ABX1HH16_9BACT|nr:DUF4136 domain-containing protein [Hymenobacter artigasi]NKI89140.1 hypothetical protein [Hymenobacter artigasi]